MAVTGFQLKTHVLSYTALVGDTHSRTASAAPPSYHNPQSGARNSKEARQGANTLVPPEAAQPYLTMVGLPFPTPHSQLELRPELV